MKYSTDYWNEQVTLITNLCQAEWPDEEFSEEKTRQKFKEFFTEYKE